MASFHKAQPLSDPIRLCAWRTSGYLRYGLLKQKFQFHTEPWQNVFSRSIKFSESECQLIDTEVQTLLDKGAIKVVFHKTEEILSDIFLRSKKSGEMRPIINLSHPYEFIKHHHFKIENLNSLLPLIQHETFFTSTDLQGAYFTWSIHPSHRKFLQFLWRDTLYEFQVLCFGVNSAPRIFTKVFSPIYSYFRIIGITCSYFLDDTFILGRTFQEALRHTEIGFDTLVSLGFVPNIPKCSLIPSTRIRHFGFYIDSIKMTVELPQDEIDTIVDLAIENHSTSPVAIRLLSKFIGYLVSSFSQLNWGPYFIEVLKRQNLRPKRKQFF